MPFYFIFFNQKTNARFSCISLLERTGGAISMSGTSAGKSRLGERKKKHIINSKEFRCNTNCAATYSGWNIIKRRIWRLRWPLLDVPELLATGNLEEQHFLPKGPRISSAKSIKPEWDKVLVSVQGSTCFRLSFSRSSSWFFSQISLIFSSSSSCFCRTKGNLFHWR